MSHLKIPGFVTQIKGTRWWARLIIDDREYEAEMALPLADDACVGSYFTLHQPRRGEPYIYWIRRYWTKRQLKQSRIRARELRRVLFPDADG